MTGDKKKTKSSFSISIIRAQEKGYFQMSPENVFKRNSNSWRNIKNPAFTVEIEFVVSGKIGDDKECPSCLVDVEYDWNYCPMCGEMLDHGVDIYEIYHSYKDAERSEYAEELGISEMVKYIAYSKRRRCNVCIGGEDENGASVLHLW